MATFFEQWLDRRMRAQQQEKPKVSCYYEVTSTSSKTSLLRTTTSFSAMFVDGVSVPLATSYLFSTTGEHLVEFVLADKTKIGALSGEDHPFRAMNALRRVYIPDTVETIGRLVFYENRGVQYIGFPPSIKYVGDSVCEGCYALSMELSLPNLETLAKSAFYNSAITAVRDLGKLTVLNNSTFRQMASLTDLVLPATMTSLNDASVYNSRAVKRVVCYATTPPSRYGNVFEGASLESISVPAGSVDAYKASSDWSRFASILTAIPS